MNRQIKRSLEPSSIPKRTQKQQILCDAIEQNYQTLENTIKARVSKTIKDFGLKFDLSYNSNSINTIAAEILQNTVETVLNKSEEFDLSNPPSILKYSSEIKKQQITVGDVARRLQDTTSLKTSERELVTSLLNSSMSLPSTLSIQAIKQLLTENLHQETNRRF